MSIRLAGRGGANGQALKWRSFQTLELMRGTEDWRPITAAMSLKRRLVRRRRDCIRPPGPFFERRR
ncbi:hypothetical protein AJ87_20655 [Rhizobium yanglingense]|nr:hypothetical protein AJ87_20655 [Rhizobium yanglingense]